jgi:DNA-binding winged helix-turn-helix (wHTH) protein
MTDEQAPRRQIGPAIFDAAFLTALRDDGLEVRFTRSESRLLGHLARNAGRIVSRSQLLDELSEPGSDKSDRNIDFIINRLRRKLDDDPKNPRFIATRYGEGYVWIAKARAERPLARGAHVVIGPFRGLGRIGDYKQFASNFGCAFQSHLARHFSGRKVVLDPDCPSPVQFGSDCPEIGIDLTFVVAEHGLDCVFRATAFRTGSVLSVIRRCVAESHASRLDGAAAADFLADQIASEIWKSLADQAGAAEPLAVRLHKATTSLVGGYDSWQESERRLRQVLAAQPNDYLAKVMLATAIHTKYIQSGQHILASAFDPRPADEQEIEALVTSALPAIQGDPSLAIMAAKLLYFLDRGYRRMAVELAERAYRSSTTIAASLGIIGQMRSFVGQIEQGIACLDQALELSEPQSQPWLYVLVMKAQAQRAADDRDGLDRTLAQLYAGRAELKVFLDHTLTCPDNPSPEALMVVGSVSEAQARGILLNNYYACARLYRHDDQRENALRTSIALLTRRFGKSIVPDEVAASVPRLMAS